MHIKQLLLNPDRIIYEVIYNRCRTNKIIHIRAITMMCVNRVAILKETYEFNIDKYKSKILEKWS